MPRIRRRSVARRHTHRSSQFGVIEYLGHRSAIVARIATLNQTPGRSVIDQAEQTADCTRHHWSPAGCSLERDEPEALRPARYDDNVGGSVVARQDVMRLGRDKNDAVVQVKFVNKIVGPLCLESATLSTRSPND